MTIENLQRSETLLIETLITGLDAREAARRSGSAMLLYLADMMVQRAREELEALKHPHADRVYCSVVVPVPGHAPSDGADAIRLP